MSNGSRDFVEHLQDLRTYAHALMGIPQRGDAYVTACLDIVREEPGRLSSDSDRRLALFRLFHTVWDMVDAGYPTAEPTPADTLSLSPAVAAWPIEQRQILLLTTLLHFSTGEAARILALDEESVEEMLDVAQEEFRGRVRHSIAAAAYSRNNPVNRRAYGRDVVVPVVASRSREGGRPVAVAGYLMPPAQSRVRPVAEKQYVHTDHKV
jgi:hypothetical protein